MARNTKIDTKAMEQLNGEDIYTDAAPAMATADVTSFAAEAACDIIASFATNDYAGERIARQFVQAASYLLTYKSKDVTDQHAEVIKHEDAVSKDKANAPTELARAQRLLEAKQNEERDLMLFRRAMVTAYEAHTGKPYEELPKRREVETLTPQERMAQRIAERQRIAKARG